MKKYLSIFREENGEDGQAIVEFALALPLVLLILCGILDFGWIYSSQYKVEYASYTGARYASMNAGSISSEQTFISEVKQRVAENLYDKDPSHVTVVINQTNRSVEIDVTYPVRTLTFVANTLFGNYYNVEVSNMCNY